MGSLLAFHEAGHKVAYLLACKRNKLEPQIYDIAAPQRGKGFLSRQSIVNETVLEGILNSNLPQWAKDGNTELAKDEIRVIMAGNAAEYVYLNLTDPEKHLQAIERLDKKNPDSDFNRAKKYCRIIRATKLLPFYEGAIKEMKDNWKDVTDVANSIDETKF